MKINAKEILKDALPIINQYAPTIGAAIGGPVGFAAGYVLPLLSAAFSQNPYDIKGIARQVLSDTDSKTKLEALEAEHADWIGSLEDSFSNLAKAEIHINLEWQPQK